jgi:hypothetical protein
MFDDNLFRQNEILRKGYRLVRFSYSQLQARHWRNIVMDTLRDFLEEHAPHLLSKRGLQSNAIQLEARRPWTTLGRFGDGRKGLL